MINVLVVLLALTLSTPAWSNTYYVATTGSNSNDGSLASPWRDPQKCALSPVTKGDTCIVKSGSYSVNSSGGAGFSANYTVLINTNSPSGTSLEPITIQSEVPLGAVINIPGTTSINVAFYVNKPYYIIRGFDIVGDALSGQQGTGISILGVGLYSGATGSVVERNTIHDVGRNVCSNSVFGFAGVYVDAPQNVTVKGNRIYKIGRRFNGESGCSTNLFQNDHAIYAARASGLLIERNEMSRNERGFCLNAYRSGQPSTLQHTNLVFRHNICATPAGETRGPAGQIIFGQSWNGLRFENNIFSSPETCVVQVFNAGTLTNTSFKGNRTNINDTNFFCPASPPAGITVDGTNNPNATLGLVDVANNDYRHADGGDSIDTGVDLGLAFSGSAPDPGPWEAFTAVAASIDTHFLDETYNATALPVIPVSGATGHSVGCSPTCGTLTVANVSLFSGSDAILRKDISGFAGGNCADTQTITSSFSSSTGTVTDSALIGGTLNQPAYTFGPLAVTNQCSGSGPPTPPDPSHILYELDGDEADTSGNGLDGTRSGGSYVAGKYGQALQGTDGTSVSVTAPYGLDVNPSGQDLSIVIAYEVPAGHEIFDRIIAGSSLVAGRRLYIAAECGTWQIGIATSAVSCGTPSNLPVKAGWNRLILLINSTTDIATLHADNIQGTGGATKVIPDYTLASNIAFGLPSGFGATAAGGGKWDKATIYTSLISVNDDWLAWEPPATPSVGSYAQVGHQWYLMMQDGSGGVIPHLSPGATLKAVRNGGALLKTQTDCTGGADCSAIGLKLWYRRNGGEKQEVPNTFTSDSVSFWGPNTPAEMYLGTATCCITGALTENDGTTQILNVAQPTFALPNNHSITRISALRWGPEASGIYCFEEHDQNGNALASVTPDGGACAEVGAEQASGVR